MSAALAHYSQICRCCHCLIRFSLSSVYNLTFDNKKEIIMFWLIALFLKKMIVIFLKASHPHAYTWTYINTGQPYFYAVFFPLPQIAFDKPIFCDWFIVYLGMRYSFHVKRLLQERLRRAAGAPLAPTTTSLTLPFSVFLLNLVILALLSFKQFVPEWK